MGTTAAQQSMRSCCKLAAVLILMLPPHTAAGFDNDDEWEANTYGYDGDQGEGQAPSATLRITVGSLWEFGGTLS